MSEILIFNRDKINQISKVEKNKLNQFMGYTYVIDCGDCIKIGSTKNPCERFKNLKNVLENYSDKMIKRIALSPQCTNFLKNERQMQALFSHCKISNTELFDASFDDVVNKMNESLIFNNNSQLLEQEAEKITEFATKNLRIGKNENIKFDFDKMSIDDMDKCISLMEKYILIKEELSEMLHDFIAVR